MKRASIGWLAGGAIALAVVVLASLGAPIDRPAPVPPPRPAMPVPSVSAGGITLASAAIELPDDDGQFPAGPGADLVQATCTACHSASMALSQPPLSADQWKTEVTKMREAYHAPIPEREVPAIVAYLTMLPGQRGRGG